jgi:hypothetical protein
MHPILKIYNKNMKSKELLTSNIIGGGGTNNKIIKFAYLKNQNPVCNFARGLSSSVTPNVISPITAKNNIEPKDNLNTAKSPQLPASVHPFAGPKSRAVPPYSLRTHDIILTIRKPM